MIKTHINHAYFKEISRKHDVSSDIENLGHTKAFQNVIIEGKGNDRITPHIDKR